MWLVWLIACFVVDNEYILPSFTETMKSMGTILTEKSFWVAFGNTLLRTAEAFVLSFVLAALCAALSSCGKGVSAFIRPIMVFLRTLPTLAVILILLIWTSPLVAPVLVTFLVLFPMIYAQIMAAIGDVDGELIEMARVYRVSRRERLFKIYLPLTAPNVLAQTGANLSLGLKIMISAEVLASTYRSLGGLMQNARLYLEMPRLAALTLVAVAIGLIFESAVSLVARRSRRWNGKEG